MFVGIFLFRYYKTLLLDFPTGTGTPLAVSLAVLPPRPSVSSLMVASIVYKVELLAVPVPDEINVL